MISIHAPTRGATKPGNFSTSQIYFNPRSHERSDAPSKDSEDNDNISIHAPTRGATKYYFYWRYKEYISIHAPTRGATIPSFPAFSYTRNFNPRSHERSDV